MRLARTYIGRFVNVQQPKWQPLIHIEIFFIPKSLPFMHLNCYGLLFCYIYISSDTVTESLRAMQLYDKNILLCSNDDNFVVCLIFQIHIDIPRMSPLIALFQQKTVQEMFERILFIWAIRHPASGYVQGINDLVTPFYVVFLQEVIPAGVCCIQLVSISEIPFGAIFMNIGYF